MRQRFLGITEEYSEERMATSNVQYTYPTCYSDCGADRIGVWAKQQLGMGPTLWAWVTNWNWAEFWAKFRSSHSGSSDYSEQTPY